MIEIRGRGPAEELPKSGISNQENGNCIKIQYVKSDAGIQRYKVGIDIPRF
jgi:hypothetical protein